MGGWKGRGAADNPPNRFEVVRYERDDLVDEEPETSSPRTEFQPDHTRSIIARNDSPDIPFDASVNPYRGCEFGCAYCYARPFHEYLGYSAGLDFETRILVKHDAPVLLRRELASPRWVPETIVLSGVTDPYQPAERRLRITRGCLEVLCEFRNPVAVVTKSALVARDADLLAELAQHQAAVVTLTITTLDDSLSRALEPRAALPRQRLDAVRALSAAGVPAASSAHRSSRV
jgi:DNA repair photolyase